MIIQNKYKLGEFAMMNEMQQEAGDNSQQIQNKNCVVVVNSLDEKRVREICDEKLFAIKQELTFEAWCKANERVKEFENHLVSRMKKIEDSFQSFLEPAFHFILQEAQKTAAQTDIPTDYELLSELLVKRITNGNNNRNENSAIKKAVQVVNEVSDDSLIALSVSLAIRQYSIFGDIRQGLNFLDDSFKKFLYRPLPSSADSKWIDNLETIGAIRILSIAKLNTLETLYLNQMPGYCVSGIKKQSDTYEKSVSMLEKVQLPHSLLLCNNELNEDYVRIPIFSENAIENLQLAIPVPISDLKTTGTLNISLTEEQKEILHKIFSMYDKDSNSLDLVKENFYKEIISRENLNTVREWWNNIPIAFELTSVGRILAYSNLKRLDPTFPDLK